MSTSASHLPVKVRAALLSVVSAVPAARKICSSSGLFKMLQVIHCMEVLERRKIILDLIGLTGQKDPWRNIIDMPVV